MKLRKLLKDLPQILVKGSKDIEISGVCSHSQRVAPGNLFIAKKGRVTDGSRFLPDAVSAGASAVVTDIYDPTLNVVQIIHPDPGSMEALLAATFHQFPSDQLFMVGITGTNGKTTTAFLVRHLLDKLGVPCGLIGTIENIIGSQHYVPTHTTPDVASNHKMLREMVLQGCQSAVMEVTSHALDQGRVDFINYDVAVFTNLSQEHLDYHGTMGHYAEAKQLLFMEHMKRNKRAKAILNLDSPWGKNMQVASHAERFTYAIEKPADLYAENIQLNRDESFFTLVFGKERTSCRIPLIGKHNIYNALAAASVVLAKGFPFSTVAEQFQNFCQVAGRLERVPNELDIEIIVDFAHKPEALENVLLALKELKRKRIVTVFGCGGDRDRGKRPMMAAIAEKYSDYTIVTSDNPRTEDPLAIVKEIVSGFQSKAYEVCLDRREAIQKGIELCNSQDILLIAGKGHEKKQYFAQKIIDFDDCAISAEICREKARTQGALR